MKSLGVGAEPLFLGLRRVVCEIHPLRNVAIVLPQPTRTHLGIIPIAVLIPNKTLLRGNKKSTGRSPSCHAARICHYLSML